MSQRVRFTYQEDEYRLVEACAKDRGMTVGQFVRAAALGEARRYVGRSNVMEAIEALVREQVDQAVAKHVDACVRALVVPSALAERNHGSGS